MVNVWSLDFTKDYATPQLGVFTAYQGFKFMGGHCHRVVSVEEIQDNDPESIVIGGIGFVQEGLKRLGVPSPEPIDYPTNLRSYLQREIWENTIRTFEVPDKPIFIKPMDHGKLFTGKVVSCLKDMQGLGYQGEDIRIWCSEPIQGTILAEFRVFIRYGKVLDIRKYKGDPFIIPDAKIVHDAIKDYKEQPLAYSLDFCVTSLGKTVLVEANDAYALGDYGLDMFSYSKMVYTRWSEIVNCKDYFNF